MNVANIPEPVLLEYNNVLVSREVYIRYYSSLTIVHMYDSKFYSDTCKIPKVKWFSAVPIKRYVWSP